MLNTKPVEKEIINFDEIVLSHYFRLVSTTKKSYITIVTFSSLHFVEKHSKKSCSQVRMPHDVTQMKSESKIICQNCSKLDLYFFA